MGEEMGKDGKERIEEGEGSLMDEESISKRVNEFAEMIGKEVYKGIMDSVNNFDEMTVNEAIKFLDEFSDGIDCEQCPVYSSDCAKHGCLLVRSVSAIKKGTFVNVTEEELEDIKTDLCDNYCSKRKEWTGDPDAFIEEVCVNCPLTQL